MDAPYEHYSSVHVLRHTFQPSDALEHYLKPMIKARDGEISSRFILTSTREVAVDQADFQNYKYDLAINELNRQFRSAGNIALRAVQYNVQFNAQHRPQWLNLRFVPAHLQKFESITDPIDTLQDIVRRSNREEANYAKLQIDARQLVGGTALAAAYNELRARINHPSSNLLFELSPYDISGPVQTVATALTLTLEDIEKLVSEPKFDGLMP